MDQKGQLYFGRRGLFYLAKRVKITWLFQLASALEIDTPMYSRIERGERKAKREQVVLLAKLLGANEKELLQLWLADKVYDVLAEEDCADGVINMVAENIREYGK